MLNRSPDSGGAFVRTHSGYERVSFFRRSGRLSVWRVFFCFLPFQVGQKEPFLPAHRKYRGLALSIFLFA